MDQPTKFNLGQCKEMWKEFESKYGKMDVESMCKAIEFNGRHIEIKKYPEPFEPQFINKMDFFTFKEYCSFYTYIFFKHYPDITCVIPRKTIN